MISAPSLDHRDFIAAGVEAHLIHERADQEESSTAAFLQVGRISRIGQLSRVEAKSIISNHKHGCLAGKAGDNEHSPIAKGLLLTTFVHELPVIFGVFALAQFRSEFEVAVFHGIDQTFVQGGSHADQAGLVRQVHQHQVILKMSNERLNAVRIIGQNKA